MTRCLPASRIRSLPARAPIWRSCIGSRTHAATEGESLSTRYIENHLAELTQVAPDPAAIGAGALALLATRQSEAARMRRAVSDEPHSPWDIADAFELTGSRESAYDFEADGGMHKSQRAVERGRAEARGWRRRRHRLRSFPPMTA